MDVQFAASIEVAINHEEQEEQLIVFGLLDPGGNATVHPSEIKCQQKKIRSHLFWKSDGITRILRVLTAGEGDFLYVEMPKECMSEITIRPALVSEASSILELVAEGRLDMYHLPETGLETGPQTADDIRGESAGASQPAWLLELTDTTAADRCVTEIDKAINNPADYFYKVALQNDELVGVLSAGTVVKRWGEEVHEINWFFVRRGFRSLGIGTRMLAEYFEWASAKELPTIVCVVDYNEGAIRFYEERGCSMMPGSEFIYDRLPLLYMRHEQPNNQSLKEQKV